MPKELPCPHCGQDIHIPARYNADEVSRLERIKEAAEKGIRKFVFPNGSVSYGFDYEQIRELHDALEAANA